MLASFLLSFVLVSLAASSAGRGVMLVFVFFELLSLDPFRSPPRGGHPHLYFFSAKISCRAPPSVPLCVLLVVSQLPQALHTLLLERQPRQLVAHARVPALVVDILLNQSLNNVLQRDDSCHVHAR